ncbi:MAG: TetR family transcriptional regulator [Dehalococcoidia bacterium]|nr:TetR family transcriptional regulator [Dehalococcoidia bacterium]
MAPRRKYTLGKRAASVAATRQRIIEAAVASYRQQGILGTSMQAVARQADVAAGTVLYHFPTREELAQAVLADLWETLHMPTADIFAGADSLGERVGRLVHALFALYERTTEWGEIYVREKDQVQALVAAEAQFGEAVLALVQQALGPMSADEQAIPVVLTLTDPHNLAALTRTGMSVEAAADTVTEVLLAWLGRRAAVSTVEGD